MKVLNLLMFCIAVFAGSLSLAKEDRINVKESESFIILSNKDSIRMDVAPGTFSTEVSFQFYKNGREPFDYVGSNDGKVTVHSDGDRQYVRLRGEFRYDKTFNPGLYSEVEVLILTKRFVTSAIVEVSSVTVRYKEKGMFGKWITIIENVKVEKAYYRSGSLG